MIALAIHGGAGSVIPKNFTSEEILQYEEGLKLSLQRGFEVLDKGGTAIQAVTESVLVMEDSPLFNAGCGSVLTTDEKVQMDASIMSGFDLSSGAITLSEKIKNPILAADLVRKLTPHKLLGGVDVDRFALEQGLELMPQEYFIVPKRLNQLREAKRKKQIKLDHSMGTVGAVARDKMGNLAAATSTGGLTNKLSGRVSDSSIIGAGTYANNQSLAISGTGTGDIFIQNLLAYETHALMLYKGLSLSEACKQVLDQLKKSGGSGGVIAISSTGEVCLDFVSEGMFRGYKLENGQELIRCFSKD